MSTSRELLAWCASALAFPLAGLAARGLAGPIDDLPAAVVGGATAGLVIGAGQALAARGRLPGSPPRWAAASAAGSAIGLAIGSAAVGYGTSLGALAAMGAIGGAVLGLAQGAVVGGRQGMAWALATALAWSTGWAVTTAAGVDVERQHAIFGLSGALAATLLLAPLVVARTER